jgi:hypothetical protein
VAALVAAPEVPTAMVELRTRSDPIVVAGHLAAAHRAAFQALRVSDMFRVRAPHTRVPRLGPPSDTFWYGQWLSPGVAPASEAEWPAASRPVATAVLREEAAAKAIDLALFSTEVG